MARKISKKEEEEARAKLYKNYLIYSKLLTVKFIYSSSVVNDEAKRNILRGDEKEKSSIKVKQRKKRERKALRRIFLDESLRKQ